MKKPNITEGGWRISKYCSTNVENIHGRGIANAGSYSNSFSDTTEENKANAKAIRAVPEMIDIGIKILKKLQSETASVTALDQMELAKALKKAGVNTNDE